MKEKIKPTHNPVILKLQSFLSRRDHSEQELKTKLLKHFSLAEVKSAIALAYEKKWLKEPMELAHQWTEELHRKKKGWLYIINSLRQKRLPEIDCDEEKEEEKGKWWIEKKFSAIDSHSLVEKQKVIRFLINKGFTQSISHKVFQDYFENRSV